MEDSSSEIIEIIEGDTRILVPADSIKNKVPPKEPAFFNPKAKLNRDFSIIAYSAFTENFDGPKIFLEGLTGLGARGLRVKKEIKNIEKVIINDLNPKSLELAKRSASLNDLENFETSEKEVCNFLSNYSRKTKRGSIVDIDPFGSPAKYIDCGIRATMHGGLLSTTATDLQVLRGLFQNACKRRYGGVPIRTEFGNEIAIRLILGLTRVVASRFDIEIVPLFVETDMHYCRTYVKILNRPDQSENMGFIFYCKSCGHRGISLEYEKCCMQCNSDIDLAGPLWIGSLFDKNFVDLMLEQVPKLSVDKVCSNIIQKCSLEADMPATYYTLDEIASRLKTSPLKLEKVIDILQDKGFKSSPTSLNPTGFRTDAKIDDIKDIFVN